jgi:hypothetical protein
VSTPQCTTFCPDGRYRKMASAHLLLPWQAYKQGLITTRGMKVYYALHEMAERRRYTPSTPAHYGVPECHALLGSTLRVSDVEREIDTLCTISLVHWSPSTLQFPTQPAAMPRLDLSGYRAMQAHVHPKWGWFPMGRRIQRYLVREGSARQIVTAFYLSQRCYWDGERGICAGAVSPAAIADCFGFAERTATRHLTALAALGWCTVEPRPLVV